MKNHPTTDDHPLQQDDNQTSGAKKIGTPQRRVIRDGFSLPSGDYQPMLEIQASLLNSDVKATKSEVLRVAPHALKQLRKGEAAEIIGKLEPIKTGCTPRQK